MKDLKWLGNSKEMLLELPKEVRQEVGFALFVAQQGETHHAAKLFRGHGSGIYEIVSSANKNAYRTIYIANIENTIYVLHVFQKKSKTGIKTPREEINVINQRLKRLKTMLQN